MNNLKCFAGDVNPKLLDRSSFGLNHKLADHPALSLENLAKVAAELPSEKVLYSKALTELNINFDKALYQDRGVDFAKMVETIRTSNSYIAIKSPELHPSFKDLYADLISDISRLMQAKGSGVTPMEPTLWLFIASPGAVTPFHFDRYSNIVMQIRGSKEFAVFPPRVEEVISQKVTEAYMDWKPVEIPWTEGRDKHALKYNFKVGEAIHIPFTSGHYVKNGTEDISISLSIFFHTDETLAWSKAMKFNNHIRRFGYSPKPIGENSARLKAKASLFHLTDRMFAAINRFGWKVIAGAIGLVNLLVAMGTYVIE